MSGFQSSRIRESPDDLMAIPLADLVRKLDHRVRRLLKWQALAKSARADERLSQIQTGALREIALIQNAATALRARAAEVVSFAASIRVRCRAAEVRENPHLVACALMRVILGPDYGAGKSNPF